ncbi:MAG: ROK family protein [Hespellia sp.]|nr:ROK family protein [Hespellia sp.]
MNYLAIDVGGTFTKYAVITDECQILEKDKSPTVTEPLEGFISSLVDIYQKYEGNVDGIALSMPGIIDSETGFMYTGGNLACITNLNIVEVLEKRCGVHVTVENDAKCAALAEVWKGALMDVSDAIVVVCGTGVGGAVIHDRKVLKGIHNMAGEFSYIMTDAEPEYTLDNSLAGNTGIKCMMKFVSKHTGIPAEELDGEKAFSMANCGDEKAIAGIREYVKHLAIQINNYQFIFDPEKIVVGGGISVQPLFLQMIKEELKKINAVYPWDLPIADVDVCKFFNDANLIGAVYVHIKSKERKIDIDKMNELLDMVKDRREGQYLMELLGK